MMTRDTTAITLDLAARAPLDGFEATKGLRGRTVAAPGGPLYLRILPRPLRLWIARRQTENALIAMWQTTPHLLDDIGVVLGRAQDLPAHLIPAPTRLLQEVAITAPEAIAEAERAYPPTGSGQTPRPVHRSQGLPGPRRSVQA